MTASVVATTFCSRRTIAVGNFVRAVGMEGLHRQISTRLPGTDPKYLMLDDQATSPEHAAEIRRGYTAYTPMLRLAHPDELANAALFCQSACKIDPA